MAEAPVIIAIGGGAASGKSTIARALAEALGDAQLVCHDWYYRDQAHVPLAQRARKNYDHPDALETELLVAQLAQLRAGDMVEAPSYDYALHTRAPHTHRIRPRAFIVVDGMLSLQHDALRGACEFAVYIDAPPWLRLRRKLRRDVRERGRTAAESLRQFVFQTAPMHRRYVLPSRARATLVVSGAVPATETVAMIVETIFATGRAGPNPPNPQSTTQ